MHVLIFFMAMPCYGSATKGRKLSATRITDRVKEPGFDVTNF